MFSVRALARAAPRVASRITARSTSSALSTSFQPALRSNPLSSSSRIALAAFSTSRARSDEYAQQLAVKLASEIELETEESNAQTGSDSNVASFLEENSHWSVTDKEGDQDVYLQRKFEDEDITVHFNISDFETGALSEEPDLALGDEEVDGPAGAAKDEGREDLGEGDELQPAFSVNVNVLVQRPNKGSLRFNLIAENGEFLIDRVAHLPQSTANPAELLRQSSASLYSGPPFGQLDEDVQQILENYLHARGITTYLATFVPDFIDGKEQKEYLAWLGRVKSFVD